MLDIIMPCVMPVVSIAVFIAIYLQRKQLLLLRRRQNIFMEKLGFGWMGEDRICRTEREGERTVIGPLERGLSDLRDRHNNLLKLLDIVDQELGEDGKRNNMYKKSFVEGSHWEYVNGRMREMNGISSDVSALIRHLNIERIRDGRTFGGETLFAPKCSCHKEKKK